MQRVFLIMSVCLFFQGCAASVMSRQQYLQFIASDENKVSLLPSSYCGDITDGIMVSPLIPLPPIIPVPDLVDDTQRINVGFDKRFVVARAYLRTNDLKEVPLNFNIHDSIDGMNTLSVSLNIGCKASDNGTLVLIFKTEDAAYLQLEWHIKYVIEKEKLKLDT